MLPSGSVLNLVFILLNETLEEDEEEQEKEEEWAKEVACDIF